MLKNHRLLAIQKIISFHLLCILVFSINSNEVYADDNTQYEFVKGTKLSTAKKIEICLRENHTFHVYIKKNDPFFMEINSMLVGKANPIKFSVISPSGKNIENGSVNHEKVDKIKFKAPETGVYKIQIKSGKGAYIISMKERPMVISAPLHLFRCQRDLFMPVPEDTESINLYIRGGGGKELAGVEVFDSNNKRIKSHEVSQAQNAENLIIPIEKSQHGKIWRIHIRKVPGQLYEDSHLIVKGKKNILLALSPSSVMTEKILCSQELKRKFIPILKKSQDQISTCIENKNTEQWQKIIQSKLNKVQLMLKHDWHSSDLRIVLDSVKNIADLTDALANKKLSFNMIVVRVVDAITNNRIYPDRPIPFGRIGVPLKVKGAQGETVSCSFAVTAEKNIKNLKFNIGKLKQANGKYLPTGSVDIKVVKVWYQDTGGVASLKPQDSTFNPVVLVGEKQLVPELLLHNDKLIKVDRRKKENYMFVNGKYVCISSPGPVSGKTRKDFPIVDSAKLQPVNIPIQENKQFWVTVNIPKSAIPGIYKTQISFNDKSGKLGKLPFEITVLPFQLAPSRFISSIYYYPPDPSYYGSRANQLKQYRLELTNLRKHSITDIMFPYNIFKWQDAFDIWKGSGLNNKTIFYRGWKPKDASSNKELISEIKKHMKEFKDAGINNIYFYGIDEARGETLKKQRKSWDTVHKHGGKIFVSGYTGTSINPGNFAIMGDIQDMLVHSYYPIRAESSKWHSKGHKIVSYANPQGGVELPDTYRRNFGYLLWQYGYDGCMTYIYHWGAMQGRKGNLPCAWNDFGRKDQWKQHNMVYPSSDGVIDTLQWEGYREAADDLRYLSTLLDLIDNHKNDKRIKVRKTIKEAKKYLNHIKNLDLNTNELSPQDIRRNIITYIMALKAPLKIK